MAHMVKEHGFNTVMGPVVDLRSVSKVGVLCPVIGGLQRAYSHDPKSVVVFSRVFVHMHRSNGIKLC